MYEKLNLQNGEVLADSHIEHLQKAILGVHADQQKFKELVAQVLTERNIPSTPDESLDSLSQKVNQLGVVNYERINDPEYIDITTDIKSGEIKLLVVDNFVNELRFYVNTKDAVQFEVDWGDGTDSTIYSNGSCVLHNYTHGTGQYYNGVETQYVVTIRCVDGTNRINQFRMHGNRPQILWFASKDVTFTSGYCMFKNEDTGGSCQNLRYIDFIGGGLFPEKGASCYMTFRDLVKLERLTGNINTTNSSNGSYMFANCKLLKKIDQVIDTSNWSEAVYTFGYCETLQELPRGINVKNCNSISYMLLYCKNLTEINFDLDLPKCTFMYQTFLGCENLETLPPITNTHNVTTAYQCFSGCKSLKNIHPILDFSSCTEMGYLFNGCNSLVDAPSVIMMPKATTVAYLFQDCKSMKTAPNIIDAPNANNANNLFYNCTSLRTAPTRINLPKAINVDNMFNNCTSLTTPPKELILDNAQQASNLFINCNQMLKTPNRLYLPNALRVNHLFQNCWLIETIDCDIDFPNAVETNNLFHTCRSLKTFTRNINVPKSIATDNMFYDCNSLEVCPEEINFPETQKSNNLFRLCYKLKNAPTTISMPKVISAYAMFSDCTELVTAPTTLNLPVCQDLSDFFIRCQSLPEVPQYSFPECLKANNFFNYCKRLEIANLPITPKVVNLASLFYDSDAVLEIHGTLGTESCTTFGSMFYSGPGGKLRKLDHVIMTNVKGSTQYYMSHLRALEGSITIEGANGGLMNFELRDCPKLTSINFVNMQSDMRNIWICGNGLDATALNNVFKALPNITGGYEIQVHRNPGASTCDTSIATNKGWKVRTS